MTSPDITPGSTEGRFDPALLESLIEAVGAKGCITDADDMLPYITDRRSAQPHVAPVVVRPANTAEVSRVIALCQQAGVSVVPQGGNTGLVEGSVPLRGKTEVVLSLSRMTKILDVDVGNATMTVEAGAVLADVQVAADDAGLLFPLSLAAEGSCRIGGNLSTNAGGTAVVRYGNARDLVLGLEVVLADGRIWDGLRGLRKDNTGYDLKHVFIGTEGTLGVITRVVLKLFPKPKQAVSALVGLSTEQHAASLLTRCQSECGENISSFEYIHRNCLDLVFELIPGGRDPLPEAHDHYVLLELSSSKTGSDLREALEHVLAAAFEADEVEDATIASSVEQANALWKLREDIPEATRITGTRIGHDVSVPVSRIAEFLERGSELVRDLHPCARLIPFGHMGDGNIHFNMVAEAGMPKDEFLGPEPAIRRGVYDLVQSMSGSFSAEHGIGSLKRDDLKAYRSEVEVDLMRTLKSALDPGNILNPGKVV